MTTSEAQKRALKKYRAKLPQVNLVFYPKDDRLYQYLETKGNKSAYLRQLLAADMEASEAADQQKE